MTNKILTAAIRFPCDLRKLVLVTTHAHFDQLPICLKMKDIRPTESFIRRPTESLQF